MEMSSKPFTVLVADDNTDDCLIALVAWEEIRSDTDLRFVHDGRDLMDYLYQEGKYFDRCTSPRPELIILDLNMPKKDGRQALAEIQADANLNKIPIVVFTSSTSPTDMSCADTLGAYEFVTKPATIEGYRQIIMNWSHSLFKKKTKGSYRHDNRHTPTTCYA